MRIILLLPLTAMVAGMAGCGSQAREQTTGSVPQRDLTLVTQIPEVRVASSVETQRVRSHRRAVSRPRSRQPTVIHAAVVASAPVPADMPVAPPASPAPTSANDRELLPGKTVTLIPASTGPSAGPDDTAELPAVHGRTKGAQGGGRCRGGGRGPGIARAPRPDFR